MLSQSRNWWLEPGLDHLAPKVTVNTYGAGGANIA
jgi:transcription factor C subunit 7